MIRYKFEKLCKNCGKSIDEDIYDDNKGLCDDCYIERKTYREYLYGCGHED
jgi:NMD protein affecting ribosome stability and mRNA decay